MIKGYKGHTGTALGKQVADLVQTEAADQTYNKCSDDHNCRENFLSIAHLGGENHNDDGIEEVYNGNQNITALEIHFFNRSSCKIGRVQFILPAGKSQCRSGRIGGNLLGIAPDVEDYNTVNRDIQKKPHAEARIKRHFHHHLSQHDIGGRRCSTQYNGDNHNTEAHNGIDRSFLAIIRPMGTMAIT